MKDGRIGVTYIILISHLIKKPCCNLKVKVMLFILKIPSIMSIESSTVGFPGFNHLLLMAFLLAALRIQNKYLSFEETFSDGKAPKYKDSNLNGMSV